MLMVYIILILLGILSLLRLPVELYPNISFGEVSIIIEVRGGIPPTEVEALVTKLPLKELKPFGDTEPFKERFGLSGRPIILTFGLLSPGKGIEVMIEAMARVVPDECHHMCPTCQ